MESPNMAVFPMLTFFLGIALGLMLYPKIIGFHYDEPSNRHN
jgi:hypothetical protein